MISVSMNPGQIALARMFLCPYSADADLVTEITAALAALYTDVVSGRADALSPPTDDQLTIDPPTDVDHRRDPVLHPEQHAPHVDVHHQVVVGHRQLGDRPADADAGHVQHRVDPAELRHRGLEQRGDVGFLRHVAVHRAAPRRRPRRRCPSPPR